MTAETLRRSLASVPEAQISPAPAISGAIDQSVRYLGSDAARASMETDAYWPKWDSPWWHMLLLFEVGEARRIPKTAIASMIDAVEVMPMHTFPIWPGDAPPGTDLHRDVLCHCALGSLYQVLTATGVDVPQALPWVPRWFPRYQMADGGLNCDDEAYRVTGECPSSIVGTVAPLEAMLLAGRTPFVDRAAGFLMERRLMYGSATLHNADERAAAPGWLLPCFPRFYFYDVLRGATALARWAQATGSTIPAHAIAGVINHLVAAYPDGLVPVGRAAVAGHTTLACVDNRWIRIPQATRFPLLDAVGAVGAPSPYLTREWTTTRRALSERIVD